MTWLTSGPTSTPTSAPTTAAHARWLESEADRLLAFGRGARLDVGGFGWLGDDGVVEPERPRELYMTCRMTYCFALGALLGRPGCAPLVDHGVAALTSLFRDAEHGGWFTSVAPTTPDPVDDTKAAYGHAFVVLAAAAAVAAGRPGAEALLAEALDVSLRHFWDDDAGMSVESFDRSFTRPEDYRGVNANMHTVEAYLAAADVTGDRAWLDRAARITERVVHGFAAGSAWRIPEHFDTAWRPLPEYNADDPAHPFRPYGATVGHWMEWARLTLHVRAALAARGDEPPAWMVDDAAALVDAGVREGWSVDGGLGFVYTVDWEGRPVVRERMHWVLCEAIGAAAALHAATGDPRYERWYRTWWDHAVEDHVDPAGGWWHELDAAGAVSRTVWSGKPDLYHALQATLIPRVPLAPVLAPALARGLLDRAR